MNNRIYKFRAWDKEKKIMCKVFNIQFDLGYAGIRAPNYCVFEKELEKLELMQWTGIKDKNGKEIYEGDILQHIDTIVVVEPIIPIDRFYSSYETPYEDDWMSCASIDWEVIGNIYENPELLKEKK